MRSGSLVSILEHCMARMGGRIVPLELKLEMILMSFLYFAMLSGSRTCSSSLPGNGSMEFQCSGQFHRPIF
jgi:hypothetical protein